MEYLQYLGKVFSEESANIFSFKPYYKWNTFNTVIQEFPSCCRFSGFKPYYKWNTFNTF